jgi:hypothetical protein
MRRWAILNGTQLVCLSVRLRTWYTNPPGVARACLGTAAVYRLRKLHQCWLRPHFGRLISLIHERMLNRVSPFDYLAVIERNAVEASLNP